MNSATLQILITSVTLAVQAITGGPTMPDVPPSRGDREPASVNPSGVSGAALPDVPQGARREVEAEVVALYDRAASRIREQLGEAVRELAENPQRRSSQFRRNRAATLLRSLQRELDRIDAAAVRTVSPEVERAYKGGISQAGIQARKLGLNDALPDSVDAQFGGVQAEAVRVIARDTVASMAGASRGQADRAVRLFRALSESSVSVAEPDVNRAIADGLITGDPRVATREIRRLFDADPATEKTYRQLGNQIVQVGGWQGPLRTYASTVVRTRTREATVTGRHQRLSGIGIDLVQITGRVSANFCTRFIGLVVSLGDARDGYPSIRELPGGGPPFHPNCSKGTAAYVPDLVSSARVSNHERALDAFRRAQSAGVLTEDLRT